MPKVRPTPDSTNKLCCDFLESRPVAALQYPFHNTWASNKDVGFHKGEQTSKYCYDIVLYENPTS